MLDLTQALAPSNPLDAPLGTKRSGFTKGSDGPFHCANCVHLPSPGRCDHPEVMADPDVEKDPGGLALVDGDDCCFYQRKHGAVDLTEVLAAEDGATRTEFAGIPIAIETPKGSVRTGHDPDGGLWRTKMKRPYGYIERVSGLDNQWLDCFVGPDASAAQVYIVRAQDPDRGVDDEDKVMLGYPSEQAAVASFLDHYDDSRFLGPVRAMDLTGFKEWLGLQGAAVTLADIQGKPIGVDFDGVMAKRREGHHDELAGDPIPEGFELVKQLRNMGLDPYILTARTNLDFIRDWLDKQGCDIEVTNRKRPGTLAIIDDRAVDFEKHGLKGIVKRVEEKLKLSMAYGNVSRETLAELRKAPPLRDTVTPFWDKPVHKSEVHINFRKIQAAVLHAQDRLAALLVGPLRVKVTRALAAQAVRQLQKGKSPHALSFKAPAVIEKALAGAMRAVYDEAAAEAQEETDRLLKDRSKVHLADRSAAQVQGLVANVEGRYVNYFANALRDFAIGDPEGDEDLFVAALNRMSEAKLDGVAGMATRETTRAARADVFEADPRLRDAVWRRSSVLEPGRTCAPCWNADGQEIDGPDDDLTMIHEGPPESCMCVPYADLTEVSL